MQPLQRTALRSARRLRPQTLRQCRRNASDSHGHDHAHSHDAHHHAGPTTESFGAGLYVCLAAVPLSFGLYQLTRPDASGKQPYFTRVIAEQFNDYRTRWADRNDIHTQAMQQAAHDRALFMHETSQNTPRHIDHRFPEILNASSPYNVPAGRGSANLDALIAKYEKEQFEANEIKLQQLKDNKVPVEQPYESFRKIAPFAPDSGS